MMIRPRFVVLSLLVASLAPACSSDTPAAGVMVVMRTDMTFPGYVHYLGLYIAHIDGSGRSTNVVSERRETEEQGDGTRTVSLPSDFAIQSNGDEASSVRVRVVAYDIDENPLAMRESRTRVPSTQLSALPMPLLWMNSDVTKVSDDPDAFVALKSTSCPEGETPDDNGDCVGIDRVSLEAYQPFTAAAPTEIGTCTDECFDVSACFKPEFAEDADDNFRAARAEIGWFDDAKTLCGVPLGFRGQMVRDDARKQKLSTDLAVAVRVGPENGAYCTKQDPNECYIVIDAKTNTHLDEKPTPQGPRLWAVLPKGICRKWEAGQIVRNTAVAVPGCKRKAAGLPMCRSNQVGCATDEGWDGSPNPRKKPDGTPTPGIDAKACRVPGASALAVEARHVVVMTTLGQVVPLAPNLAQCELGAPVGLGEPARGYRLTGGGAALAFMDERGQAGEVSCDFAAGTCVPLVPDVLKAEAGPLGAAGFAQRRAYVGPNVAFLDGKRIDAANDGPAGAAFTHVTNGIAVARPPGFSFLASSADELVRIDGPLLDGGYGARRAARLSFGDVLHTTAVQDRSFTLARGKEGVANVIAVDGNAPSLLALTAPEGSEAPRVEWDATLVASKSALFFGATDGRIYRVDLPSNDTVGATLAVAWSGVEPIHAVQYVPASGRDPRVAGLVYFITWPGGDPAQARVQRIALDGAGTAVPLDDEADLDTDAGNTTSSSGESSSSSTSSGNGSSGAGSSSGNGSSGAGSSGLHELEAGTLEAGSDVQN